MKPRIIVRALSEGERQSLSTGLRSSDAFVLRRSQILLASTRGETAPSIAKALSCDEQTVRHAIHAFNQEGLAALPAGSSRPHHLPTVLREDVTAEMVKAVLHRPPRDFGFATSLGTLDSLVKQCVSWLDGPSRQHQDHAPNAQPVGDQLEASQALDQQPRSVVPGKKPARDRLMSWTSQEMQATTWAIGFLDEVWWSRFALPKTFVWQDQEEPVRLVEQRWQKADPDAKALAWYGVLWQRGPAHAPIRDQVSLRFVDGRPVSAITTQILSWCCATLEVQGC